MERKVAIATLDINIFFFKQERFLKRKFLVIDSTTTTMQSRDFVQQCSQLHFVTPEWWKAWYDANLVVSSRPSLTYDETSLDMSSNDPQSGGGDRSMDALWNKMTCGTTCIPRIVHQVWFNTGKGVHITEPFQHAHQSVVAMCKQYNYVHVIWDESMALALLRVFYPSFIPYFMQYKEHIYRIDAIRYFILYTFGGIYLDMDVHVSTHLDHMIRAPRQCVLTRTPTSKHHLSNFMMASCMAYPLMFDCMQQCMRRCRQIWHIRQSHLATMYMAGPWLLESCTVRFLRSATTCMDSTTMDRNEKNLRDTDIVDTTRFKRRHLKRHITLTYLNGTFVILSYLAFMNRQDTDVSVASATTRTTDNNLCEKDQVYGNHSFEATWNMRKLQKDMIRLFLLLVIACIVGILLVWVIRYMLRHGPFLLRKYIQRLSSCLITQSSSNVTKKS